MEWLDYREKLGIGFNDQQKVEYFMRKMFNFLDYSVNYHPAQINEVEYFEFCNMTGSTMIQNVYMGEMYREIVNILCKKRKSLNEFLVFYIALVNCQEEEKNEQLFSKEEYRNILTRFLKESKIQFEIIEDEDGCFVFPAGARELDDALVSDNLIWLEKYPNTRKAYISVLRQYADRNYIRDIADNLRKTLELFLQEFLQNEKNLETNKNEICRYLGQEGIDPGISGLFQPLINAYKNLNDRTAKHNDKVDERLLEFLLYQTGILIRMVLKVGDR